MRWALALGEFDFEVLHKPGLSNPADYPSRYPMPTTLDTSGAKLDPDDADQGSRLLPDVLLSDDTRISGSELLATVSSLMYYCGGACVDSAADAVFDVVSGLVHMYDDELTPALAQQLQEKLLFIK
jgi:hypothetical protein